MTTRQVFALIAVFGVYAAHADDHVNSADANGDGFVSLYELRAAYYADPEFNRRIEKSFDDYDRNGDGLISEIERRTATNARIEIVDESKYEVIEAQGPAVSIHGGLAVPSEVQERAVIETHAAGSNGANEPVAQRLDSTPVTGDNDKAGYDDGQSNAADDGGTSRTESWVMEIDADKSGGASIAELLASGGGKPWFTDREFSAADRNGDGDLNATELAALVRSLERRQR